MQKVNEWIVEVWVDGAFDYATTFDADRQDDALKEYEHELASAWMENTEVRFYESVKTLLKSQEAVNGEDK
jgi:CRISPR/Cas system-associated endonuclease Cas3-HD